MDGLTDRLIWKAEFFCHFVCFLRICDPSLLCSTYYYYYYSPIMLECHLVGRGRAISKQAPKKFVGHDMMSLVKN
jgi:hypothetical protein